jgi:hypothetical protein
MSRARSTSAIITGLPPGEASTFLAALASGYGRAQEAAQSAYSDGERQARKRLARDLYWLASQERSASREAHIGAPRLVPGRRLARRCRLFPEATCDQFELEAGE